MVCYHCIWVFVCAQPTSHTYVEVAAQVSPMPVFWTKRRQWSISIQGVKLTLWCHHPLCFPTSNISSNIPSWEEASKKKNPPVQLSGQVVECLPWPCLVGAAGHIDDGRGHQRVSGGHQVCCGSVRIPEDPSLVPGTFLKPLGKKNCHEEWSAESKLYYS